MTTWFHQDQLGSVRRTSQNGKERSYQEFDAYGNVIGSPQSIFNTAPQLRDEFNKGVGVRLGTPAAIAGTSNTVNGVTTTTEGLHWSISGTVAQTASVPNGDLPHWVIGKSGRARPMAGALTPSAASASDSQGAGRAMVDTGTRDGSVSATLTEDFDTSTGNGANGSSTITGYAVGLSARGGAVNLWAEIPGPSDGTPPFGTASRKLRLTDANGTTIPFAGGATVWANVSKRDKITLTVNGTTASVFLNDSPTAAATATISTARQAASAATTWGMVYKTTNAIGNAGKLIDAWDGFRFTSALTLTRFAYAGAEFDPETGFYHMGPRIYDPVTSRFLQQDPAPPSFDDAINLYRYGWDDPIDNNDPTGMGTWHRANDPNWEAAFGTSITSNSVSTGSVSVSAANPGTNGGYGLSVNSALTTQDYLDYANSVGPVSSGADVALQNSLGGTNAPLSLTSNWSLVRPTLSAADLGRIRSGSLHDLAVQFGDDGDDFVTRWANNISGVTDTVAKYYETQALSQANAVTNLTHDTWLEKPGQMVSQQIALNGGMTRGLIETAGGIINLPGQGAAAAESVQNYQAEGSSLTEAITMTVVHRTPILNIPFLAQQAWWGYSTDGANLGQKLNATERWQAGLNAGGQVFALVTPAVARWGQKHHIATNKHSVWTPQLKEFFDNADLSMNNKANVVRIKGHRGPHPEPYHQFVFDTLERATDGLTPRSTTYRNALLDALDGLRESLTTDGSYLNNLVKTPR